MGIPAFEKVLIMFTVQGLPHEQVDSKTKIESCLCNELIFKSSWQYPFDSLIDLQILEISNESNVSETWDMPDLILERSLVS